MGGCSHRNRRPYTSKLPLSFFSTLLFFFSSGRLTFPLLVVPCCFWVNACRCSCSCKVSAGAGAGGGDSDGAPFFPFFAFPPPFSFFFSILDFVVPSNFALSFRYSFSILLRSLPCSVGRVLCRVHLRGVKREETFCEWQTRLLLSEMPRINRLLRAIYTELWACVALCAVCKFTYFLDHPGGRCPSIVLPEGII